MRASNGVGFRVVRPLVGQSLVQDTSTANISHANNYGALCANKRHSSNAGITYEVCK